MRPSPTSWNRPTGILRTPDGLWRVAGRKRSHPPFHACSSVRLLGPLAPSALPNSKASGERRFEDSQNILCSTGLMERKYLSFVLCTAHATWSGSFPEQGSLAALGISAAGSRLADAPAHPAKRPTLRSSPRVIFSNCHIDKRLKTGAHQASASQRAKEIRH